MKMVTSCFKEMYIYTVFLKYLFVTVNQELGEDRQHLLKQKRKTDDH